MPGLTQRNAQFSIASSTKYSSSCSDGSVSANGIWSKHSEDVTFDQLQKFWSELTPQARQELLRIDKQTLFEQARKSLYCSRCNGLLLEGFSQIVMYGKSLQLEGAAGIQPSNRGALKIQNDSGGNIMRSNCQGDIQDPSVHPWGGLAATRDGLLTLLDCFLSAKSLKAIQNVFDSARARERERELLYPDACGGGGRGWISQGAASYGRGHGIRETCALHTARLSCDTLVDFWSALGDDTRRSLLRMKEEDFIERLMYRDCRRNVIREFKELKELKRIRKEPRCTSWFCVADTAFQYEVSDDTVHADWHQSFVDTVGTYHHFEWALGTGEGKSDVIEFEDVGMNGCAQVNGLDLGGLSACFITLRAWKLDGRCTELSVKAHALKGQPCVHRRLVVGDGFVTITKGDSIRRFFEHAEEAEEEEDDDSMDKDGNELEGESYHPQKHAKSPELAREFLLDAATVIFKEQVEKAFREGTARQNAHSIFLCLALKLLEKRVHVACKEIITFDKQIKLLEEEEKEKREEEDRKERRKLKEKEKKLRRKERIKEKEKDRETKCVDSKQTPLNPDICTEEQSPVGEEESSNTINSGDSIGDTGDSSIADPPQDIQDEQLSYECVDLTMHNYKDDSVRHVYNTSDGEVNVRDANGLFTIEQSKSSRRKLRFRREFQSVPASKWCDRRRTPVTSVDGPLLDESDPRVPDAYVENPYRCSNGNRQPRNNPLKSDTKNGVLKSGEKYHCSNNRMRDRYDYRSCGCNQNNGYRSKDGSHISVIRSCREVKTVNKLDSPSDISRPFSRSNKYNNGCHIPDNCVITKSKVVAGNVTPGRDFLHTKKVWEPLESRKKYPRNNSDSDVTLGSTFKVDECKEGRCNGVRSGQQQPDNPLESLGEVYSSKQSENSGKAGGLNYDTCQKDDTGRGSQNASQGIEKGRQNGFGLGDKSPCYSKDVASSSDNCSSCLSEGESSSASSSIQNVESLSTSDSEDASQQSDGRDASTCGQNGFLECQNGAVDNKRNANGRESLMSKKMGVPVTTSMSGGSFPGDPPIKHAHNPDSGRVTFDMGSQPHCVPPPIHNQNLHFPVFPAPSTMGYYHQHPASWSAAPANGLLPFSQPNRYLFTGPLGYGLSANGPSHFCMQYSGLQPLTTPVLNVGPLPVYQPVNNGKGLMPKDQNQNSRLFGEKRVTKLADAVVSECSLEGPAPNDQALLETPSHGEDGKPGHTAKLPNDSTNFSLFHFGGPIAVATGHNCNPVSLKKGTLGDFPLNSPAGPARVDSCTKETNVEEYSLFASSNGTRFSFF
ncbi:uncharacterized protein LOC122073612 isoform X2 [Macadamia integrifolia]|uniref:uncharacterized protein LOC122073612 isoform X2 n=1 Tax=Macadamia integrifolia TaxID=60698 RepID=UPI001C4EB5C1|nr:uncharacterized protein LOC122073612 isoform X2 [Macadamia integrifolia]